MTTPVLHLTKGEGTGTDDGGLRDGSRRDESGRDGSGRDESGRDESGRHDHPRETTTKYCLHCGWQVRAADGFTRRDRSAAAVEHFVATGHTVDSL